MPAPSSLAIVKQFLELSAVPRPSHHESRASRWLCRWAREHGFAGTADAAGNVWMEIPATAGREDRPLTILQGHMDMVAIGPDDGSYNPLEDGIDVDTDGKWLFSVGHRTTLGADDGIGVAIALATVTTPELPHGPLRLLFTVNEEDGMHGAEDLEPERLADASYLINLDSGSIGEMTVGSAACAGCVYTAPGAAAPADPKLDTVLQVTLEGCTGGHSGVEITRNGLNAIRALAGFLLRLQHSGVPFQLAALSGGAKRNAIPVSAGAVLLSTHEALSAIEALADQETERLRAYAAPGTDTPTDPKATIELPECHLPRPEMVFTQEQCATLLNFLCDVPNGVQAMSPLMPGLPETSTNLGLMEAGPAGVSITLMPRSSNPEGMEQLERQLTAAGAAAGYAVAIQHDGAAWPARTDTRLCALAQEAWQELTGSQLRFRATHGGLECGYFLSHNPNLQVISMSPLLEHPHTVLERCEIASCGQIAATLAIILSKI